MSVYSLYVISKSGSLQFTYDHTIQNKDVEKSFSYPVPIHFKPSEGLIMVDFGATEDVPLGHVIHSINGVEATGAILEDGRDILKVLSDESNFPLTLKFGRPRLHANRRMQLASTFQLLHQMVRVLSPVPNTQAVVSSGEEITVEKRSNVSTAGVWNSGIQTLETAACRTHCFESPTGVKFLLVTDAKLPSASREALKRIYKAYTDFVLKNPFYAPEQPFNYEFFTKEVKTICEQVERGIYTTT